MSEKYKIGVRKTPQRKILDDLIVKKIHEQTIGGSGRFGSTEKSTKNYLKIERLGRGDLGSEFGTADLGVLHDCKKADNMLEEPKVLEHEQLGKDYGADDRKRRLRALLL